MAVNFAVMIALLVLVAVLIWIAWRAWHMRSLPLRILGGTVSVLLGVVVLAITIVMARGMTLIYIPRATPVAHLNVEASPERLARGQALALTTCAACHARNGQLPLTGGADLSGDIGMPIGTFYPPNLTPAGDLPNWSDGQILRALREGIDRHGMPLGGMPSQNLRNLSDDDAQAIIAYLRSQVAAGTQVPATEAWPLGVLLIGAGVFGVSSPPVAGPVTAPPRAEDAAYGQYIVSFSDCNSCHGADLRGGQAPGPQGPNLQIVRSWTREQFISAMRTGINPGGHEIQPPMPWKQIGQYEDTELAAIHEYLRSIP